MKISGSVALVTGANRGLGKALVHALNDAGAKRVYAAARNIQDMPVSETIRPIVLDITDARQVDAAASQCGDVEILINNAGVARFTPALAAPTMENARQEMETNYFGTLAMCRAFAPVLKQNSGGAIVNVLSVVSFFNAPMQGTYCASKAAAWSLTKDARFELRAQGTKVMGVYAGYINTDMTTNLNVPKVSAAEIATRVLEGVESGAEEVLADQRAQSVYDELRKDDRAFDAAMQKAWDTYSAQKR